MIHAAVLPVSAPAPIVPDLPHEPDGFAALCDRCDWIGPKRPTTLGALGDFDRHLAGATHRRVTEAIASAIEAEDTED